jgi:hypothetical protein
MVDDLLATVQQSPEPAETFISPAAQTAVGEAFLSILRARHPERVWQLDERRLSAVETPID